MQTIKLVHNPGAGDEEHGEDKLVEQIEKAGFRCRYSSTKKDGWKEIEEDTDIIAVAGGDGTVRKLAKQLLKKKNSERQIPVALLALGTANNIAKTLNVSPDLQEAIASWKRCLIKRIDIGQVSNVEEVDFFLEGFGFGLFPNLMKAMEKEDKDYPSPEEELTAALEKMHELIEDYEPRECRLAVDGTDHSGRFYMVEVMNIRSIGPNVLLAPMADPGDGEFEVVLIPEAHKDKFAEFIRKKLKNAEEVYHFHTLRGKNITIRWEGQHLHADDELVKIEKGTEIEIELKEGALHFLVNHEPAGS